MNKNVDTKDAMNTLLLCMGTTTAMALKNDCIFRDIELRERIRTSYDTSLEWAKGAETLTKNDYIRAQMAWTRDLAEGRWPVRDGVQVPRSELIRGLYDTAEFWRYMTPSFNFRRRKRKNVKQVFGWYEVWRLAVVGLYEQIVTLTINNISKFTSI